MIPLWDDDSRMQSNVCPIVWDHCLLREIKHYKWLQLDCSPNRRTRKINFPTNRKVDDKSETAYKKLPARRIQICWIYFCVIHFDLFFPLTFQSTSEQKQIRQDQIRLIEYSYAEGSGPSEMSRFVGTLFLQMFNRKSSWCVCTYLIIECSRVHVIASAKQQCLRNYQKNVGMTQIYAIDASTIVQLSKQLILSSRAGLVPKSQTGLGFEIGSQQQKL